MPRKTTLRVPDDLVEAADALAAELGVSRNEALIRLAATGARIAERAREIAERRDRRWQALLAASGEPGEAEQPSLEEMREAAFALRNSG